MTKNKFNLLLTIVLFHVIVISGSLGCELMGMCFNKTVPVNDHFSELRQHGMSNPDGWGIALYPDNEALIFKEAKNARQSDLASFVSSWQGLKSGVVVAHLRAAAVGGSEFQNTHPFRREQGGRHYVLAHNGVIRNYDEGLILNRHFPVGINDTEFLLCYLVGKIEERGIDIWSAQDYVWFDKLLHDVNDYGNLNILFADGKRLFIFRDKKNYNTLYHLERNPPYGPVHFISRNETVDLSIIYDHLTSGHVFSTKRLTNEDWEALEPGRLLVVESGGIVYDNKEIPRGNYVLMH
jgi:predicted glutamine amidotransferase